MSKIEVRLLGNVDLAQSFQKRGLKSILMHRIVQEEIILVLVMWFVTVETAIHELETTYSITEGLAPPFDGEKEEQMVGSYGYPGIEYV